MKKNAIYVKYNGDKKRITPDSHADVKDVTSYVNALQKSLDDAFGTGKVKITTKDIGGGKSPTFETQNTPAGTLPTLKIEATRVKDSSLMRDIRQLLDDLDGHKHANNEDKSNYKGIREFLDKF